MRSKAKLILGLARAGGDSTVAGVSLAPRAAEAAAAASALSSRARRRRSRNPRRHRTGDRARARVARFRRDFADADVRAVLDDIREAVAKQAPDIAGPVIDKAESDDKITAAQADKLRQAAADIAAGKRPDIRALWPRRGRARGDPRRIRGGRGEGPRRSRSRSSTRPSTTRRSPRRRPTASRDSLKHGGPGRRLRPRPGPGGDFGPPPIADKDVRAVLEDVHSAVAKQAPDIVGPVIDKAESDGKITAAQADKLRDAVGNLVGGKPRGGPPRGLAPARRRRARGAARRLRGGRGEDARDREADHRQGGRRQEDHRGAGRLSLRTTLSGDKGDCPGPRPGHRPRRTSGRALRARGPPLRPRAARHALRPGQPARRSRQTSAGPAPPAESGPAADSG